MLHALLLATVGINLQETGSEDEASFYFRRYKEKTDRIFLKGNFVDKPDLKIFLGQSDLERNLLKREILLGEFYTPRNDWPTSIIGTIDRNNIDVYHTHRCCYLRNRIVEKELNGDEQVVHGELRDFSEVFEMLKKEPRMSYHLERQIDGSWKGKEFNYGVKIVVPENFSCPYPNGKRIGMGMREIQLRGYY